MLSSILAAVSQRDFWTRERIKNHVAQVAEEIAGRLYAHPPGPVREASAEELRAMLLFSTSKQRTWLVTDGRSVCCVLDDVRREEPRVEWAASGTEVQPIRAEYDYSPESGVLYFGSHGKDRLFSKDLFGDRDVAAAVQQFLNDDPR